MIGKEFKLELTDWPKNNYLTQVYVKEGKNKNKE